MGCHITKPEQSSGAINKNGKAQEKAAVRRESVEQGELEVYPPLTPGPPPRLV